MDWARERWCEQWAISAASRVLVGEAAELAELHLDMDLHPMQVQHHNHDLTDSIVYREALLFHLTLQRLYEVEPEASYSAAVSSSGFRLHPYAFPATLSSPSRHFYSRQDYASGSAAT
jgi:hypothetical protein